MDFTEEEKDAGKTEEEKKTVPEKRESVSGSEKKSGGVFKRMNFSVRLALIVFPAVLTAAFTAYFLLHEKPVMKESSAARETADKTKEKRSLDLEPFVAPFEPGKGYTYIKVNLSFEVEDEKLFEEVKEKRILLRKTIYELLLEMVKSSEKIPNAVNFKKEIGTRINPILMNGKIDKIFITEFTAV
jgi:flagellar basal body-associated protein FliL